MPLLLTRGVSNPKTRKRAPDGREIRNVILHLAPASLADPRRNACPWSTAGCRAACLNSAGRGQIRGPLLRETLENHAIHATRMRRTREFWADRAGFVDRLAVEIGTLARSCERRNAVAAVRLNGTSDIPWESQRGTDGRTLFERFPSVQFYDYTKGEQRARKSVSEMRWPLNYHLTYSRTESDSAEKIRDLLAFGVSVAVVFANDLPAEWNGARVIDGTTHDFRFTDPRGVVVGLRALGRGALDTSGFVVRDLLQIGA